MPLPQQHLGLGVGADLTAAVPALPRRRARRLAIALARRRPVAPAAMPKIPGALDPSGDAPHPDAVHLRSPLGAEIGSGVAVAEVLAIGECLPAADHAQVHVRTDRRQAGELAPGRHPGGVLGRL